MKSDQVPAFAVRAALDHGINSFGYAFEPPEGRAALRLRAFSYGQKSNLAHVTTGAAPAQNTK